MLTVRSVNDVLPDEETGNVTLPVPDAYTKAESDALLGTHLSLSTTEPQTVAGEVTFANAGYPISFHDGDFRLSPGGYYYWFDPAAPNADFIGMTDKPGAPGTLRVVRGVDVLGYVEAGDYYAAEAPAGYRSYKQLAAAFAALIDGAPGALDTLKEIAAQLASDEQGAAALLARFNQLYNTVDVLGTVTQSNTSEIAALKAGGGRFMSMWTARTTYKKNDEVIRPDGLARVAAKADFTSGASYDETKWTVVDSALSFTNLPVASTSALGAVRLPAQGGLRISGTNGVLRNEAVYYTSEQELVYDVNLLTSASFGLSYALTNFPDITLYPPTDTSRIGFVCAFRNRSATQATTIKPYEATIDGKASFALGPGEQVWIKYTADSNYQVVLYAGGRIGDGGGPTYTAGTGIAISAQNVISATGGGGAGPATYQAQSDATNAYSDVVLLASQTFRLVKLINASAFTGQILHTDAATAWGPQRSSAADLSADIAAAFAGGADSAVLRVAVTRIDQARLGYLLFTLN